MLKRVSRLAFTAALMIGVGLLAACMRESEESAGQAGAPPTVNPKPARAQPVEAISADMVSAVTNVKEGALVDLKFALKQHPVAGQPADIEVALIPAAGLERVYASFSASEGLELRSGAKTPAYEHPEGGVPVGHTLTIVPQQDGIFYVTAVVLTDSPKDSIARTFSIPVIAGAGLSAKAESKVASPAEPTNPVANVPAADSRQTQ